MPGSRRPRRFRLGPFTIRIFISFILQCPLHFSFAKVWIIIKNTKRYPTKLTHFLQKEQSFLQWSPIDNPLKGNQLSIEEPWSMFWGTTNAIFARLPAVKQLFASRQTIVWLRANIATEHRLSLKEYWMVPRSMLLCPPFNILMVKKENNSKKMCTFAAKGRETQQYNNSLK